jgi:hypothetical protein
MMTSSLGHLAKNSCRACPQRFIGRYLFKLKVEVAKIVHALARAIKQLFLSAESKLTNIEI